MNRVSYTLERGGNEIDVIVEYEITPIRPASGRDNFYDPASGGEIDELTVLEGGIELSLTPDERERIEDHIRDVHEDWD